MEKRVRLQNKQQNEQVKQKIIELYEEDETFGALKKEHDKKLTQLQTDIKNFMFCNGAQGLRFKAYSGKEFADNPQVLECRMVTPCSVEFLPDKMAEKLGKERASQYVNTNISISDWQGFMEYMKEIGADAKTVKSFLSVTKEVDKKALDNAEKLGQVSMEELKGCYKVTKKSSYLRITKKEQEDEENEV